ncbi:MAG: bifunctional tetrahydrofolate synthase/dihydrofolate synthase [Betaproteobacteria bacterium]|nr:bifunctional tetrahydrofolate synthase/dihydrofolate synthase [Betaproteobacteria bacterium]
MPSKSLSEWLDYVEHLHAKPIELGLDRVASVRDRLGLGFVEPIIIVGGTNGKGSVCAMLESMLQAAGYRTGLYTSPHLLAYNERVRVDGVPVGDQCLADAFARVEKARAGISLTYFEFGTLVACEVFATAGLDTLILEVGLGGRLDAVNIFDADCAIVTSIGIDHVDFLGATRESIGFEKAGIFRAGRPAICGDPQPPDTLVAHARNIGAKLQVLGNDFGFEGSRQQWRYWGKQGAKSGLAPPALRGTRQLANASVALAALEELRARIPVSMQAIREGLSLVELPGRFQVMPGVPCVIVDVAHNPQAAAVLAQNLADQGFFPNTRAVIGMLADKDIVGVCLALKGRVDEWHVGGLSGPRAASAAQISHAIEKSGAGGAIVQHESPLAAYAAAKDRSNDNDRIVVFGSFLTVAEFLSAKTRD